MTKQEIDNAEAGMSYHGNVIKSLLLEELAKAGHISADVLKDWNLHYTIVTKYRDGNFWFKLEQRDVTLDCDD